MPIVSPPAASSDAVVAVMRGNRRRNSTPELALRSHLHRLGARYRVDLPVQTARGRIRPDLVFTRRRVAVFVDGCFWHGCPEHGRVPSTNNDYWAAKLRRNLERDGEQAAALEAAGWRVVRVWEHDAVEAAAETIMRVLRDAGDGLG